MRKPYSIDTGWKGNQRPYRLILRIVRAEEQIGVMSPRQQCDKYNQRVGAALVAWPHCCKQIVYTKSACPGAAARAWPCAHAPACADGRRRRAASPRPGAAAATSRAHPTQPRATNNKNQSFIKEILRFSLNRIQFTRVLHLWMLFLH